MQAPICVFDAGVGGLSVLAALRRRMPDESYVYLADLANIPYGTKSSETVLGYCLNIGRFFRSLGAKMIVVACNTATAAGLAGMRSAFPDLPILGVVEPGAAAACRDSRSGFIAVIATEGTIKSDCHRKAILALRPEARVRGIPCSLLSHVAEAGWLEGELTEAIIARYVDPVFSPADPDAEIPDCLLLGCTHFPLLSKAFWRVMGNIAVTDPAVFTAEEVHATLARRKRLDNGPGYIRYYSSDDATPLLRACELFMGDTPDVERVNLK